MVDGESVSAYQPTVRWQRSGGWARSERATNRSRLRWNIGPPIVIGYQLSEIGRTGADRSQCRCHSASKRTVQTATESCSDYLCRFDYCPSLLSTTTRTYVSIEGDVNNIQGQSAPKSKPRDWTLIVFMFLFEHRRRHSTCMAILIGAVYPSGVMTGRKRRVVSTNWKSQFSPFRPTSPAPRELS